MEMNTVLAEGNFCHGGDVVPTLNLRRQLQKGNCVNDVGRPYKATSAPTIVCCYPQQAKPYQGRYNRHKKIRFFSTEISKK